MKVESNKPLGMRPYDRARAVFPTGRDAPNDYLERCLATIAELEPQVGAFVHLNEASAREAAAASAARWRDLNPKSLIDGMPVGIKDIVETIDMPTEMGSPLYRGWQSGRDAATVQALRDAGAIILGKTVTTEFAATHPAGTKNPWDLNRTPGGSSSGSAAAVAVGMLPAALGTQVVGSIIRPASYCGCYGFKPSLGAINRGGSHDGLSQSCHGALAASLHDAWNLCWAIARRVGGDPGYPGLAGPEVMPVAQAAARARAARNAGMEGRVRRSEAGAGRRGRAHPRGGCDRDRSHVEQDCRRCREGAGARAPAVAPDQRVRVRAGRSAPIGRRTPTA